MFGNKENINILTALLVAHGVKRAVVCPGSRNAPIVHNLNECGKIRCIPVTDERCAGFYALGMSLATDTPVAVCVTSGTALLNLAPAVAEASYRHHGLIVISADRPSAWIGQLDGQTLDQPGAFGRFVSKCVNLPEPHDGIERWQCNRMVNEALLAVRSRGRMSVHINVPISEPLFEFDTAALPHERVIESIRPTFDIRTFGTYVVKALLAARKPMLVVGQLNRQSVKIGTALQAISGRIAVLSEPLSDGTPRPVDLALARVGMDEDYMPDFLLYVGDTVISKRLKNFLRKARQAVVWAVAEDGEVHDTLMNQTGMIEGSPEEAILAVAENVRNEGGNSNNAFAKAWTRLMEETSGRISTYPPAYSQMSAVCEFERSLTKVKYKRHVHYANSNAVRLACIFASHYVWCDRGVNGIEGSLPVAAGFSTATDDTVFCVIGDLSFFYGQNALWSTSLRGNFRMLLLNNHCGGIFYSLRGLQDSQAFGTLVAAGHGTDAKGTCEQNGVAYLSAHNTEEMRKGMAWLTACKAERPMLLEVFTDPDEDKRVIKEFMNKIIQP